MSISHPAVSAGPGGVDDAADRASAPVGETTTPAAPLATIDLSAIAHNVRLLRRYAGDTPLMAVVKADAYNHGAVPVARTALTAGARELGVTTIDEALELRAAGIDAPILTWLHAPGTDFAAAIAADIEIAVSSREQLAAVVAAAGALGRTATVAVKIDSGLSRNGVPVDEWAPVADALAAAVGAAAVTFRSIFTHLAHADDPHHPVIDSQRQRFDDAIAVFTARGVAPAVRHISNTAATMTRPDLRYDLVRPGIAIYGLSPLPPGIPASPIEGPTDLRPAMTLSAPVSLVKEIAAGEGVSYGHMWTAPTRTRVALIPLGYADGVVRALGGRLEVAINGRRYPGIGRICMDQFVVHLGPTETGVRAGDTAVLFGAGIDGGPTAAEWADLLDTIHYEVITGVRGRVERRYREDAGL